MTESSGQAKPLAKKVIDETKKFLAYTLLLTLFFSAFTAYRRLILDEYGISYAHYGFNLVQSLILAKAILVGQALKLGERFSDRPLIIPTVYKTVIFSLFVILFAVIEHFAIGFIDGKPFEIIYSTFLDKRLVQILASILPMSFFFLFFFAFLEIGQVLTDKTLVDLFFRGSGKKRA